MGERGLRVGSEDDGYRRKHFPDDVRPARPARWFAEAREQGVTERTSMTVRGLNVLICRVRQHRHLGREMGRGAYLDKTTVHDVADTIYCHTSLGDIGREYDFTRIARRFIKDQCLLFWR